MTYTIQDYETEKAILNKAEAYRKIITQGKRNYLTAEEAQHPDYVHATNEMRSRIEKYEFLNNPPEKYFVYVCKTEQGGLTNVLTTWTGETLAKITHVGRVYRSAFGDKRQSFWARALNGVLYHGTAYLTAGDYARIKIAKNQ
jgi:hypothetical protein